MALRAPRAVGSGEEPSQDHRVVLWYSVIPLELDHPDVGGDSPALKPIWLIIEDTGEVKRPFKFYFSNLPESTSLKRLVKLIKLRWRVERDYQELKGEIGLDHFEGRTWRGFHHHATLCAVAHGFLALRRALFPPEQSAVDATGSAPPFAAGPSSANWMVPSLRQTSERPITTTSAIESVSSCA